MSAVLIAIVAFAVLLVIGVPVAYALLIGTSAAILVGGVVPLEIVVQRSFSPTQNFLLLAIPFFILAGELLSSGKLGEQLVAMAGKVMGRFHGGIAQADVAVSMAFAGVSGSAVADAAGTGSILIPWQKREGYPAPFAAAVTASSSVIGVIIPPSIPMIVYAAVSGTSVAALFVAGILPGALLGLSLMVVCWLVAKRQGFPRHRQELSVGRFARDLAKAIPALLMPVLVLGTLITGVATVTEVSVLAAAYALLLRLGLYRDLNGKQLGRSLVNASVATGVVMLLIMTSTALSWLLTVEQTPARLTDWFLAAGVSTVVIILFMNVLMLVVGCFLDMPAAILLLSPVLIPLAVSIDMSLIQLGIIMTLNLAIGLFTPPVGTVLYISAAIADASIEAVSKALIPFYAVTFTLLMLVSFVPALTIE